MRGIRSDNRLFGAFLLLYIATLWILILTTPLSPNEAALFYHYDGSPEIWVARYFHKMIPGPVGLRIWPFLLGVLNLYLLYELLRETLDREEDRRLVLVIFAMLPGVVVSTVLLNEAVFALTLTLIFLTAYRRRRVWIQVGALLLLLMTDTAVFSLYLAVALYAWKRRERPLALFALLLTVLALCCGFFDFGGKPRGHLPELFGIYAALFSPLFFVYYFYALYRTAFEGPRDLCWTIAFTALALSILLSIRQQVLIVEFSPYLLVGTMIPVRLYLRSLRVRMRRFQRGYRFGGALVLATLLLSTLTVIFHQPLYRLLNRPNHFSVAVPYHYAEMAHALKRAGRRCYETGVKKRDEPLMRYYGLTRCKKRPGALPKGQ